jgi:tripartite-type tricarboxylate transporter receptor subunit TctC
MQERLATLGFETANVTPEELAAFLKAEIPKWAAVIQAARIKVD